MATQDDAPQAIDSNTAEELANRLCRFVLLREHMRKPLSRTDMKAAVMSEHNDRSGRIFKQVLGLANEKMRSIAGVELVAEALAVRQPRRPAAIALGARLRHAEERSKANVVIVVQVLIAE